MKSISRIIAIGMMVWGTIGCAHRRGHDPESMPIHTFGPGGLVERDGSLLPPRKHCPTCDYLGMKCPKCRTAEEVSQVNAKGRSNLTTEPEGLLRTLRVNAIPTSEAADTYEYPVHSSSSRRQNTPYSTVQPIQVPQPSWD